MSELSARGAGEGSHFSDATGLTASNASAATSAPSRSLAKIANDLEARLPPLDLFQRLTLIRAQIPGRLVFTTSFGLEDQVIGHAIFSQGLAIDVVTLDTGRLFPETFELWARTEHRYGRRR